MIASIKLTLVESNVAFLPPIQSKYCSYLMRTLQIDYNVQDVIQLTKNISNAEDLCFFNLINNWLWNLLCVLSDYFFQEN